MMRFALTMIATLLPVALAQAADMPGVQDIASKLAAPQSAPPSEAQTRSFFTKPPDNSRGITITDAKPDAPPAVDLNVNFEFNSAKLTAEGAVLVGNLGRALKDPRLTGKRFRIEGHTDAKGGDAYNQSLSERRAEAVRGELISSYGVDAARVESIGFGKSQLLDRANPEAGVNRRVRVINLGDAK